MTYLAAIILGLVQGIAEFLPISSSGHLAALQSFFNLTNPSEDDMLFEVLLHLATLAAVCIVYWKDIVDMWYAVKGIIHDSSHPTPDEGGPKPARRLVLMIIIATLPLVVVLPLQSLIEKLSASTIFIGIAFILTGVMLFVADRMNMGRKNAGTMTVRDALIVGACQAFATLPGISRSGATITSGMAVGLNRTFAVKFSFLLSLPAILGANLITLFKALSNGVDPSLLPMYLLGMLVAGVSGYFCIGLVNILAQKGKFGKFCYYCFTAGIVTLVLSFVL